MLCSKQGVRYEERMTSHGFAYTIKDVLYVSSHRTPRFPVFWDDAFGIELQEGLFDLPCSREIAFTKAAIHSLALCSYLSVLQARNLFREETLSPILQSSSCCHTSSKKCLILSARPCSMERKCDLIPSQSMSSFDTRFEDPWPLGMQFRKTKTALLYTPFLYEPPYSYQKRHYHTAVPERRRVTHHRCAAWIVSRLYTHGREDRAFPAHLLCYSFVYIPVLHFSRISSDLFCTASCSCRVFSKDASVFLHNLGSSPLFTNCDRCCLPSLCSCSLYSRVHTAIVSAPMLFGFLNTCPWRWPLDDCCSSCPLFPLPWLSLPLRPIDTLAPDEIHQPCNIFSQNGHLAQYSIPMLSPTILPCFYPKDCYAYSPLSLPSPLCVSLSVFCHLGSQCLLRSAKPRISPIHTRCGCCPKMPVCGCQHHLHSNQGTGAIAARSFFRHP